MEQKKEKTMEDTSKPVEAILLVMLALLAALIVGSWVNLQNQLDLLQQSITQLIQNLP